MALGEMHKYRDGIVIKVDGSRAVEELYIVTAAPGKENSHLKTNYEHIREDEVKASHCVQYFYELRRSKSRTYASNLSSIII